MKLLAQKILLYFFGFLSITMLNGQDLEAPADSTSNEDSIEARIKRLEEKAKRDSIPPDLSISPGTPFSSFSLGTNFDLLDGLTTNSLYADIIINLGPFKKSKSKSGTKGSFGNRLSLEFASVRGRNSDLSVKEESPSITLLEQVDPLPDSADVYNSSQTITVSDEVFSVYGRLYYLLYDADIKVYVTGQFEYSRNKSEITTFFDNEFDRRIPFDQVEISTIRGALPDTTTREEINSHFFPSAGITVFNENENVDFRFTTLVGYRIAAFQGSIVRNGLSFTTQAYILEKKVVGAKLGFEFRHFASDFINEPSYFFFISKQFSMVEFFRIFSPSGK